MRIRLFALPPRQMHGPAVVESLESRTHLSSSWENVQVGGGGYVTGLASSDDGIVYARTDVGGAYRWNSEAGRWIPITDTLPPDTNNGGHLYGIASIAVDPSNANRVFISTGKYDWSNPSGLYYTSNADAERPAWTAIDTGIRAHGNGDVRQTGERLLVDPNNPNVIYYGTNNLSGGGVGLKKYVYGTSWQSAAIATPANGDGNRGIVFVAADRTGGTISDGTQTVSRYLYAGVYSGTAGKGGVYVSSNGGESWTKVTGWNVDQISRGEVGADGTLFVTYNGGVAKVARGTTRFVTATPPGGNLDFCSLAVDPSTPGVVMVADFTHSGTGTLWRSLDNGATWMVMKRNLNALDLDGTPSATGSGSVDHVADLLINPTNPDEVWACNFLGITRTQNIADDTTTASDWYLLQKGHEEVVVLDLKSAPTGSPLATANADVNGFMHDDPAVRPDRTDRFDSPGYLSTTSVDFCEATPGSSMVWARVGQRFYGEEANGGFSVDDGQNWVEFGQLDRRDILNASAAGWETFNVGPYLAAEKAAGANVVTLVVRSSSWEQNKSYLKFSSKEGGNAPRLIVNGSTTITVTADATVFAGSSTQNYGASPDLVARNYYDQDWCHNWVYLRFDLNAVASIDSASLQLYRREGNGQYRFATTIEASPTTNWTESAINWSNRPVDLYAPPTDYYERGGRIAVSATNPANFVWYTEAGHVWYTMDRGVRWTQGTVGGYAVWGTGVSEFQQDRVALASDRVLPDTYYLYNRRTAEIYRSSNGGKNWSVIASSVGQPESYKLETLPGVAGRFWFITQNWNMADKLRYWNGTGLTTVPNMTGAVDFAFGKALPGKSNPVTFVRKADHSYWYSTDAAGGSTFTWTKLNVPAIGDGVHVMEGDRQTIGRFYVGTDGRGAFFVDAGIPYDATAPILTGYDVGEGLAQRSMVRQIDLTFSEAVTVDVAGLSLLTRRGATVAGVSLSVAAISGTRWRVSFSGPATVGGSLPDGIYELRIAANAVRDGSDNAMANPAAVAFYRLFGDGDGDRDVDNADLRRFRSAMARNSADRWYFDANADGLLDAQDTRDILLRMRRGRL